MILRDFMREEGKTGTLYYIGTASSFVCVVNAEEYENAISIQSGRYKDKLYNKAKTNFVTATNEPTAYQMFSDERITQYYAFTDDVHTRTFRKKKAVQKFHEYLDRLRAFVPFEDREIIETYKRTGGGIVLKLTGDEDGEFWDRDEYEAWVQKNQLPEVDEDGEGE